jgi:hypothetical protein
MSAELLLASTSYPSLLVLQSILEGEGMPCILEGQPYDLMPSIFSQIEDQYRLYVEPQHRLRAQRILEDFLKPQDPPKK